jgi:hypothetical protein
MEKSIVKEKYANIKFNTGSCSRKGNRYLSQNPGRYP